MVHLFPNVFFGGHFFFLNYSFNIHLFARFIYFSEFTQFFKFHKTLFQIIHLLHMKYNFALKLIYFKIVLLLFFIFKIIYISIINSSFQIYPPQTIHLSFLVFKMIHIIFPNFPKGFFSQYFSQGLCF